MDHIENKDSHADESRKVLGLPIANAGGILAGLIGSRVAQDRPWSEYPIGTRAHAFMGGHWLRVDAGWKWCNGATFPTPGGDAIGDCIELPNSDSVACEFAKERGVLMVPEDERCPACRGRA